MAQNRIDCPNCGADNPDYAMYCGSCNEKTALMYESATKAPLPKSEKKQYSPWLVVGFFGFIAIFIFPWLFLIASILALAACIAYYAKQEWREKFHAVSLPRFFPEHSKLAKKGLITSLSVLVLSTCTVKMNSDIAAEKLTEAQASEAQAMAEQQRQAQEVAAKQQKQTAMLQEARSFYGKNQLKPAYDRYVSAKTLGGIPDEDKPRLVRAAAFAGDDRLKSGKANEAEAAYKEALALDPKNSAAQKGLSKIKFDQLDKSLHELFMEQKYTEFLSGYEELRKLQPGTKAHADRAVRAKKILADKEFMGEKPENSEWDGSVRPVKDFLKATLNDYDSSEFIKWYPVIVSTASDGKPAWGVKLQFRAKNAFGAYVQQLWFFHIRKGEVIDSNDEMS